MSGEIIAVASAVKHYFVLGLAGLSGGVVSYAPLILKGEEVSFMNLLIRAGCGVLSAVFLTPLLADFLRFSMGFEVTEQALSGLGFICGVAGISTSILIQAIPGMIQERYKK